MLWLRSKVHSYRFRQLNFYEDETLFAGSRQYMLIKSSQKGLISKEETGKVQISGCDFVLGLGTLKTYIDESIKTFCNINRIISDIYAMVEDGVTNLDSIVNIIGRKIKELSLNRGQDKGEGVFMLIILLQNNFSSLKKAENNENQVHKKR